MSFNKVILIGRLGKDPEVRHLENGISVGNFTLATNEYYKDKSGERKERTEWHNIEVWRGLADVAEKYLSKGKLVCIEGKIRTDSWEDKESGNTRYKTKIIADSMNMLDKRDSGDQSSGSNNNGSANVSKEPSSTEEITDDLPF